HQVALLLFRPAQAVRRGDREPPQPGGLGAPGQAAPEPRRALRRGERAGHGPEGTPDAPGPGEHDRLHQGGRLKGDERVPAYGPDRGPQPQDMPLPPAGRGQELVTPHNRDHPM
ncbi:MAG: cAMP-binding proteins - catabolite gene activator and regulatory subunit of cAMP-dependent protein kinases, partial [uncultured Microvirga sp.]